jgi:hypothetical protein
MKKIFFMLFGVSVLSLLATTQCLAIETESIACLQANALPATASAEARRIACNIPADLQQQVESAELIGIQLRKHDMAAWLTSDALRGRGAFKKVPGELQGWLAVESEQSIIVRYYVKKDGAMFVFAEASMGLNSFKSDQGTTYLPLRPASVEELAMLSARVAAIKSNKLNCSEPFNSVIIPFTENDQKEIRVYLFSPWTETIAPIGGHHLIKFKPDGKEVISEYSQTNTCLNFDPRLLSTMDSFTTLHTTSDTPTEIHIFLSLQYRKPIYVTTTSNGITWKVDINRIRVVSRGDGKSSFEPSTVVAKEMLPKEKIPDEIMIKEPAKNVH